MSDAWPLEIDDLEYSPIPQSWIDHGHEHGHGSPRLYAVSAAVTGRNVLFVRYVAPSVGRTLRAEMLGKEGPNGGIVPAMLASYHDWAASITPDGHGPTGVARDPEMRHLRELWSDEIEAIPDAEVVADGGRILIGPNDPPSEPGFVCGICGAAYYGQDAATDCCSRVALDGGELARLRAGRQDHPLVMAPICQMHRLASPSCPSRDSCAVAPCCIHPDTNRLTRGLIVSRQYGFSQPVRRQSR